MVAKKTFREDLMYRIRVVPLFLPPLRDRPEDLVVLTNSFIDEFNHLGFRHISSISNEAFEAITSYPWPGNIRELRKNIEHAFAIGEGATLRLEDLTPELRGINPPEESPLERIEKQQLIQALKDSGGNKGKAAESLNMSRPTFWRKCKLYQVY